MEMLSTVLLLCSWKLCLISSLLFKAIVLTDVIENSVLNVVNTLSDLLKGRFCLEIPS